MADLKTKTAQQKSPVFANLTGGLNVREAITAIADNELAAASNLNYFTAGELVRRGAWVKLYATSPTTKPLLGAFQASFVSAGVAPVTSFYNVVTDGVGIWYAAPPTALGQTTAWTSILGLQTLDATQPYKFLMMAGKLVLYNGKVAFYWTGPGAAISAFPSPAASGLAFNGMSAATINSQATLFAGANNGSIYSSTDGVTWTQQTAGLPAGNAAIYAPILYLGVLYAGSSVGIIYESTDGATWTALTSGLPGGTTSVFTPVVFGSTLYAGASNGTIYFSTNLSTWTQATTGLPAGTVIVYTPLVNGTTMYAGANNGSIYSSTTGTTWTHVTTGLPGGAVNLYSPNLFSGVMYAGASNGTIYFSAAGTSWTQATTGLPGGAVQIYSPVTYNAVMYAAGGDGNLYTSTNGTTWTAEAQAGVFPLTGGLTPPVTFGSAALMYIIGAAGTVLSSPDALADFTQTTIVAGTIAVPLTRQGIVWQEYLFWIGPNCRVYWSNLGDPTTYPAANFVDVPDPYDGDPVVGAAILYGNMLIFKRYSVYILQGAPPSNLILSKLNASVGCVDPASIQQVDNFVYFVSDKGLYAANLFNVQQKCFKVEPRYQASVPMSTPANPIWVKNYKPRTQLFVAMNCRELYNPASASVANDRVLAHDYLNADPNGDPTVSEHIVGFTAFGLAATQPTFPTAPAFMADYNMLLIPSIAGAVTLMASFYDPYLYVFQEGIDISGGPQDQISWLAAPTYPPADALTKFFAFGDPDMIKIVRWLWTTGQLYNGTPMGAGIVYNNSPTKSSFFDFNNDEIEIQSPNGQTWLLGVDNDGAIDPQPTTDTTFLIANLILVDGTGQTWLVTVNNDGSLNTQPSTLPGPGSYFILLAPNGSQYVLGVDHDGALTTNGGFAPTTTNVVPGLRTAILPYVNGVAGRAQGKYVQFYFNNIGVLSQFSLDLILKGRRN